MSAAVKASLRAATWLADRVLESAVVSEAGSCAIAMQVFGGVRIAFSLVLAAGLFVGYLLGANGGCCCMGDRRPRRGAVASRRELTGARHRGLRHRDRVHALIAAGQVQVPAQENIAKYFLHGVILEGCSTDRQDVQWDQRISRAAVC